MSVIAKNMKMPKSCYRCPMANDDFYLCGATEKYLENDSEERRPDWCPLIELPPHGRLIDADKLDIHDISPVDGFCVLGVTEEDVGLADTVIEAEGEVTE